MRFFMPSAKDEKQAEEAYQAIRISVEAAAGFLLPTRYYAIYYRHNGKDCRVRVGDPAPQVGEKVIAIFRTKRDKGPFLICTVNRGVARGAPILADGDARAIHFELK